MVQRSHQRLPQHLQSEKIKKSNRKKRKTVISVLLTFTSSAKITSALIFQLKRVSLVIRLRIIIIFLAFRKPRLQRAHFYQYTFYSSGKNRHFSVNLCCVQGGLVSFSIKTFVCTSAADYSTNIQHQAAPVPPAPVCSLKRVK